MIRRANVRRFAESSRRPSAIRSRRVREGVESCVKTPNGVASGSAVEVSGYVVVMHDPINDCTTSVADNHRSWTLNDPFADTSLLVFASEADAERAAEAAIADAEGFAAEAGETFSADLSYDIVRLTDLLYGFDIGAARFGAVGR